MNVHSILRLALPISGTLAALSPGIQALKLLSMGDRVGTIAAQYGTTVRDLQPPILDYVTLSASILLLLAVLLELFRFRIGAPLALSAIIALWAFYIPGIWEAVTGSMWFAMHLGRTTGITWQMLSIQLLATACSASIIYLRFWRRR